MKEERELGRKYRERERNRGCHIEIEHLIIHT